MWYSAEWGFLDPQHEMDVPAVGMSSLVGKGTRTMDKVLLGSEHVSWEGCAGLLLDCRC